MPLNSIYEVVLNLVNNNGEGASGVWHYKQTEEGVLPGAAALLATVFLSDLVSLIYPVMHDNWLATTLDVVNLNDDTDWHQVSITVPGDLSALPMAPVVAVSLRSPKQDTGFNRGGKRLPLLQSLDLGSDGSISEAGRDSLFFLVAQMGLELDNGIGDEWTPVTVEKTYIDGELVLATVRAVLLGQWEVNRWPGTQKGRQTYLWQVPDEPV